MEYKTKDFYLSALLLSKGFKMIGSEKKTERTVFFIFEYEDYSDLNDILTDFINMTATVNVKKFVFSLNTIRAELSKHRD